MVEDPIGDESDAVALRAQIKAFQQEELRPLDVRATVDEAMRLAMVIDAARRARAGDLFGPFLAPKRVGVVLGALKVQAAGPTAPIVLGILEFVKHRVGCRISFFWNGGPETFDTALVIRAALRMALDEQGLLDNEGASDLLIDVDQIEPKVPAQPERPSWAPKKPPTRKKWRRAYRLMVELAREYDHDANVDWTRDKPTPKLAEYTDYLSQKMAWKPCDKTVSHILQAGKEGWLDP